MDLANAVASNKNTRQGKDLFSVRILRVDEYADQYANDPSDDTWEKAHRLYQITVELQVQTSQLGDCSGSAEGPRRISNARSTVSFGDYVIRGDIEFELQQDGEWKKGHRGNSEYGQVFIAHDKSAIIMSDGMTGKVAEPLKMDQ